MSIRVENDQISLVSTPPARIDQVSTPPEGPSQSGGAAVPGEDQIEVSPATARIAFELSTQGSTRAGRVQQLGALYTSGQYSVAATQIGQSLVTRAIGNTGAGTL